MSTSEGYHEYIGRCSVHRGDTMSRSGDIRSTSGDIMMHVGDTMSSLGDIMSISGGYHEYIGGCSVHWGMFSTSGFSVEIERFLPTCSPTCIVISPHMHHDISRCTEHPRCTHDIPPMYSWYAPDVLKPPDVLNIPRCTEHTLYRMIIWRK